MTIKQLAEMRMRMAYGPHVKELQTAYKTINRALDECHRIGICLMFSTQVQPIREGADLREINIDVVDRRNGRNAEPLFSTGLMPENKALLKATQFVASFVTAEKRERFIPGTLLRRYDAPEPKGALLN